MPYVTHPSGQSTHYQLEDFADPWQPHATIVIQHGFLRSSDFWYKWVPALSSKYRVIRLDARGHGRSSAPDTSSPDQTYQYTVDTILEEMTDALDQLHVEKCHFIGQGTGGIWGMLLAARCPERISSLTVIGTPLSVSPEACQTLVSNQAFYSEGSLAENMTEAMINGHVDDKDGAIKTKIANDGKYDESGAIRKWWAKQLSRIQGSAIADHAKLISHPSFDVRPSLETFNKTGIPLLILTRGMSTMHDLAEQRHLRYTVRNSVMEVIPTRTASNDIYLDSSDLCQTKVLDFLEVVEERGEVNITQSEKRRDSGTEVV